MKPRYTFYIISGSDAPVRQYTVSGSLLRLLMAAVFGLVVFIGYALHDYQQLRQSVRNMDFLSGQIADQQHLIITQRNQIQQFAHEMDDLKDQLVALNTFENKIRIIANLENPDSDSAILGVGGAMEEDLDPRLPLSARHDTLIREMHDQAHQLEAATTRQQQNFTNLLQHLEDKVDLLASTPSIRPTKGWITSRFDYRKSPFTGRKEFHHAIDFANRKGTPIRATADGRVVFAGKKWLLGEMVAIDHGHGMVTRYGHCSKLLVKRGETVKRGEIIAEMGNTGRSTGPHLHYEVRINNVPVNPEKYILN